MSNIQTIVFDLGGVVVDWNPRYMYQKIFATPAQAEWFLENICTNDWNEEQDAGRSLQEATDMLVRQFPDLEAPIRAYYGRWEEMLGGPIAGTVELLRQLKQQPGVKLYALTNWSAETFPIALNRYDFLHWFDGRVVSGEEKTRKPFTRIYQILLERFGIRADTALYLDDNLRNLHPARDLGFFTHHFQTPELLRQELEGLGVL